MRSTVSTVRAEASVVTVFVMKRTITGSTSSHTLVSDAQKRSKMSMCMYGLKYGKKRFSRYLFDMGFCSIERVILPASPRRGGPLAGIIIHLLMKGSI